MSKELLLEIGTEEIPAGFIPPVLEEMKEKIRLFLSREGIGSKDVFTYGTPRRLVLYINEVEEQGKDLELEVLGPPKCVAFNRDGKPTKAAIGFARSQGVSIRDLKTKETNMGKYLYAIKRIKGKETIEELKTILPLFITSLNFPKRMRWADSDISFARPIRWILAIFGSDVVDFELNRLKSGRITYGHRFLNFNPIEIEDANFSIYKSKLNKNHVIVDQDERREIIENGIKEYIERGHYSIPLQEEEIESLLNEITYLVEYPKVIKGSFDDRYLELPIEVLAASMREHHRFIPLASSDGKAVAHFLFVSNCPKDKEGIIRLGNERVLLARLKDALFFFRKDQKIPLEDRLEEERGRIFQERLGTIYEKTNRIIKLAASLARLIAPSLEGKAMEAALLSKTDLSTEMVREFPKLQGIMGYRYALLQGKDEEVAVAIKEHYLPRSADDRLPKTKLGAVLALADKMDSIVGFFIVGLAPTSSEDPYGLKRQAQGIINIILEDKIDLSLREFIKESMSLFDKANDLIRSEIEAFFSQRIVVALNRMGIDDDEIEAVIEVGSLNPLDTLRRALALREIRCGPDFESLVVVFKRAMNILKRGGGIRASECKDEILVEQSEIELFKIYLVIKEKINESLKDKDYKGALCILSTLKRPIDDFFDNVLVMAEDVRLRENRLALLSSIVRLFLMIADISYLRVKE